MWCSRGRCAGPQENKSHGLICTVCFHTSSAMSRSGVRTEQMMLRFCWFIVSSVGLPQNETITQSLNTSKKYGRALPGGLPERRAGTPPWRGCGASSPAVRNEMLFTRFSFRREKLSVARLQREVAQSKSEGTMVSCGTRLLCGSYCTASVQALAPFRLAEDEPPEC